MHNTLERNKQTVLAFSGDDHVRGIRGPGQPGTAIEDEFRLDPDGKIVDHRDVMQPIPDAAANENGMF